VDQNIVSRKKDTGEAFLDALSERSPLPIIRTFYPLGFPLEISTNSPEVIEAALESWRQEECEFGRDPVRLRVLVEDGKSDETYYDPVYRSQSGLLLIVSSRGNFGVCDLVARSGWCLITAKAVAERGWFRWYFLEAMSYLLLAQRDTVPVHAACVALAGRGVLLCGASGMGKTSLAFACARAGWTYVGDDATMLLQGSTAREVLGKPHRFRFRPAALELFPELQGRGSSIQGNGKPSVEVSTSAFPEISTASRCRIKAIVFLNRTDDCKPAAQPLEVSDALDRLARETPDYGDPARGRHLETLERLAKAPAWELRYSDSSEALALLSGLV
jgi:hypothetical protein